MPSIAEPARDTPVCCDCQVLVAGAGLSGVCAAVAAARAGAKTLLVEHSQMLGGVATAGLMASFNNRFIAADGTQVVRGIAGEIVARLVEVGGARPDWRHAELPHVPFDPELLQLVLGRLVGEARVEVVLGSIAADAARRGARIAVILQHRTGRQAVVADTVVDATGDAVVAAMLGAEHAQVSDASASLEFRMAGVDLPAFFEHFRQHPEDFAADYDLATDHRDFVRNWAERGIFHLPHGGGVIIRPVQEAMRRGEYTRDRGRAHGLDWFGFYATADTDTVIVNSNFYAVDAFDPRSISQATLDARERCHETAQLLRRVMPGFARAYLAQTAPELGIRISRRVRGAATLTRQQLEAGARHDDVIAVQSRLLHIEHGERRAPGVAELPYAIMVPAAPGLLVASGKTVSTEPRGMLRAQVSCMILGQAAGAAAAVSALAAVPPSSAPVRDIQRELLRQGAYLGDDARLVELGLAPAQ